MNHLTLFTALLVWVAAITVLARMTQRALSRLQEAHESRYLSTQLARELSFSSDELTRLARLYAVTGDETYEAQFWAVLNARNGKTPRKDGRVVPLKELMANAGFTEAEFSLLRQAEELSNVLVRTETVAMNAVKGLFEDGRGEFIRHGEPDLAMAARIMHDEGYQKAKALIMAKVEEFEYEISQRTIANIAARTKAYERLAYITMLAVPAMFILAVLSFFVMKRQFARPLLPVVNSLSSAATELTGAAKLISVSGTAMNDGARIQASSLLHTRSELEVLAQASEQNSHLARQAKRAAEAARENAKSGAVALETMTLDITELQRIGAELSHSMKEIDSASNEVQKIIASIDAIAFQTNILAINAAVEAARAGEAGRGFAVVAAEVRNLSKRCTQAAKETSTLLRESSLKIVQGMSINTQVSHNLEKLTATTQGVDVSLRDISSQVFSVDDFMNQVVDSCEQQSTGIASIRVAVGQVDDVIQGSLARADEYTAAANSLSKQARRISDAVNQVESLIGSRAAPAPRAVAQLEF